MSSEGRSSNLVGLEHLLSEFFHPNTETTANEEIQQLLDRFSEQDSAWSDSLYFLRNSRNNYVCMFASGTLESLIASKWVSAFTPTDKQQIRQGISELIYSNSPGGGDFSHFPPYVLTKLAKLLVDIAKTDWPHFYPDFMTNIYASLNTSSPGGNVRFPRLGVQLLTLCSQEL